MYRDQRYINDCWWRVEYQLTWAERFQSIKAYFFKALFGGCLADYYSEELEEMYCGYNPIRHILLGKVDEQEN